MKPIREAQPQQGQTPQPSRPPERPNYGSMGKVITVIDPGGSPHRARVGAYMGAENGFELEMEGDYPYPSILSSQLTLRGWTVPKLDSGTDSRQSELARLGAKVRRTAESAQQIVNRLLG